MSPPPGRGRGPGPLLSGEASGLNLWQTFWNNPCLSHFSRSQVPSPQLLPHPEAPQPFFFWPKMLSQPKFAPIVFLILGAPPCAICYLTQVYVALVSLLLACQTRRPLRDLRWLRRKLSSPTPAGASQEQCMRRMAGGRPSAQQLTSPDVTGTQGLGGYRQKLKLCKLDVFK